MAVTSLLDPSRTEALLLGQTRILERVARGDPLGEILTDLVLIVEEIHGRGMLGSILLLTPDGGHVTVAAAPSIPAEFSRAIEGRPIGPEAGSCGTAAFLREPVYAEDIEQDPRWREYREAALASGLRACWSTPIFSSRREVLGTFALYYRHPATPGPYELKLIETLSHLSAVAIEHVRTQQERERLLERMSRSESRLRNIIELAPVGIFQSDEEGSYVYVSDSWRRLTGLRSGELETGWLASVHPDDRDRVFEAWYKSVQQRAPLSIEYRVIGPAETGESGTWVLSKSEPIRDASGKLAGYIGVIQDISESKRVERGREALLARERQARIEAERSAQLREDFLLVASHELRTPLTPLRLSLQILSKTLADTPAAALPRVALLREAFERSSRMLDKLVRLTENLLDVTRLTAGRLVGEKSRFDLSELVSRIADRARASAGERAGLLHTSIQPGISGVWDRARIEQVVDNILSNALKYGEGKPIEITLSSDGGQARLQIRDHGIGISPEDQAKIFRRFERQASLKHFEGIGLGLYISQAIIVGHGGRIRIHSRPGQGACFFIELPLRPASGMAA